MFSILITHVSCISWRFFYFILGQSINSVCYLILGRVSMFFFVFFKLKAPCFLRKVHHILLNEIYSPVWHYRHDIGYTINLTSDESTCPVIYPGKKEDGFLWAYVSNVIAKKMRGDSAKHFSLYSEELLRTKIIKMVNFSSEKHHLLWSRLLTWDP